MITPPLIIVEDADISIFKSVDEAESQLEGPDVLDGRYVAYDSEGRWLKVEAVGVKETSFFGIGMVEIGSVRITAESEDFRVEALRDLLIEHLRKLSFDAAWLQQASLSALLSAAITRIGFT